MPFPFKNQYSELSDSLFEKVEPTPVKAPEWIAFNRDLSDQLGLDTDKLDSDEGLGYFSGNVIPDGAQPISQAYAGHQFGGFSPQLGDGRAILLGEVIDQNGKARDIQLKGAGPTPFSRRGDGRSALGPVIREYLLSEAMHALGVPTTRALAAVWTGEKVRREAMEAGGIFTRVASSHLRIGTVEYFAARQDNESLQTLVNFALDRHYPENDRSKPATSLLEQVCAKQASLIAQWLSFGFIHGVMNTDNMTLSGETIDYGPCAFLDRYDPEKKFSYIDQQGRYSYINQPVIGQWNLTRLAEGLFPLLIEEHGTQEIAKEKAEQLLERYVEQFESARDDLFARKIGFESATDQTRSLVETLLALMQQAEVDFTVSFHHLSSSTEAPNGKYWLDQFAGNNDSLAEEWLTQWRDTLQIQERTGAKAETVMKAANPVIIPRNHRVEEAIQAAYQKDYQPFQNLAAALAKPFEEIDKFRAYQQPPTEAEEVKCTFCGT